MEEVLYIAVIHNDNHLTGSTKLQIDDQMFLIHVIPYLPGLGDPAPTIAIATAKLHLDNIDGIIFSRKETSSDSCQGVPKHTLSNTYRTFQALTESEEFKSFARQSIIVAYVN